MGLQRHLKYRLSNHLGCVVADILGLVVFTVIIMTWIPSVFLLWNEWLLLLPAFHRQLCGHLCSQLPWNGCSASTAPSRTGRLVLDSPSLHFHTCFFFSVLLSFCSSPMFLCSPLFVWVTWCFLTPPSPDPPQVRKLSSSLSESSSQQIRHPTHSWKYSTSLSTFWYGTNN